MNNRIPNLYTISYQKHYAAIRQKQGKHAFHGDFSEIVLPISSDVLPYRPFARNSPRMVLLENSRMKHRRSSCAVDLTPQSGVIDMGSARAWSEPITSVPFSKPEGSCLYADASHIARRIHPFA
jgi:hypothetical protein